MKTVHEIMSPSTLTCEKNDLAEAVAQKMFLAEAHSLPVVDAQKKVIGSVAYLDICMAPNKLQKPKELITIGEVMTHGAATVNTFDDEAFALRQMRINKANTLPVVDHDNTLKGTVSFMSIARRIIGLKRSLGSQAAGRMADPAL